MVSGDWLCFSVLCYCMVHSEDNYSLLFGHWDYKAELKNGEGHILDNRKVVGFTEQTETPFV